LTKPQGPELARDGGAKPRVVYFVTEDWYFCSHRLPLAIAAREAGFDVTVITRVRKHGRAIQDAGLRLIPLELSRRGINPLSELRLTLRLTAIYQRERPDIVHHVAMKPVLHGSLAAWLAGTPHIVNAVAGLGWLFTSRSAGARILGTMIGAALRLLLNRGTVIVQNPDDQAFLIRLGVEPSRLVLIRGSGVDTRRFAPQPEPAGTPTVILASRMLWNKGVGEFVEAARMLRGRGVDARFVLVGDSDDENRAAISRTQLKTWHDENAVEWWGQRDDMPEVLAQSHIVCLPSYREGLPKVLLEAAANGRAVITADTPGCREIVRDGINGLLVPAHDATALADAMESLLADPERRREMARRGIEIVRAKYSQEIVLAKTLDIYSEQLKRRPARPAMDTP